VESRFGGIDSRFDAVDRRKRPGANKLFSVLASGSHGATESVLYFVRVGYEVQEFPATLRS
jgi:hypothetical protein